MPYIANAFTCTGAYAVLIMSGLKYVENRSSMPVPAIGRCAMSVSKKFCRSEYDNLVRWMKDRCGEVAMSRLLAWDEVKNWSGCVVGTMNYKAMPTIPEEEVVRKQCMLWNEGYANWWVLSNIKKLRTPIPYRGNVGMWKMDDELKLKVMSQEGA